MQVMQIKQPTSLQTTAASVGQMPETDGFQSIWQEFANLENFMGSCGMLNKVLVSPLHLDMFCVVSIGCGVCRGYNHAWQGW